MKGNPQKKRVFQDNFIKRFCCSARNHPEGWRWYKRKARKTFRNKTKQDIRKDMEIEE